MRFTIAVVWSLGFAAAAGAQFSQYTSPGGPQGRLEDKKAALEKAMEEARFQLGPVRLAPRFSLRDGTWVDEAAGPGTDADFSVVVGAGLNAYLRTGRKLLFTAHALPEYVHWQDLDERRRLNQRFGAGAYAYFNRLTVEVEARRRDEQRIVTPELLQPVNAREDRFEMASEVSLSGSFAVFATAAVSEHESLAEPDDPNPGVRSLLLLDRREEIVRVGGRLRRKSGLSFGLGVESSRAEFAAGGLARSNSGVAPVLEGRLERPRFFVRADLAARSLEASQGASFVDFDELTGGFETGVRPTGRLDLILYGSRNLVYSLIPDYSYLTDDRLGTALAIKVGWRTSARLYFETGTSDYTAFTSTTPRRQDDLVSYGASAQMNLGRSGILALRAGRTRLESNLPGLDRTATVVSAAVSWGRDL